MKKKSVTTIDEYIETFPIDVQKILQQIRRTIKSSAPNAEEAISYMIPTFKLQGNLVHFAAYKNHIGFYPASFVNHPSVFGGKCFSQRIG